MGVYSFKTATNICKSGLCNSAIKWGFLFQNSPKNLDLSYMTDLDFLDCF